MHASKLSRVAFGAALPAFLVGWLLPSTLAGQEAPSKPGIAPVESKTSRPPKCDSVISGAVTREVGTFFQGPPQPAGMKDIQVRLLDPNLNRVAQTRTDRDGRYSFRQVCPGTYTVCPGIPCPTGPRLQSRYSPASTEIRVPPALHKGINFGFQEPPPPRQPPIPK